MLIIALSILIFNFLHSFMKGEPWAGISAAARIEQVVLLPIIGVGIGSLAIIGQNYGAGQMDRVRAMFALTARVILALTVLSTLILLLFSGPIARFFATPGHEAWWRAQFDLFCLCCHSLWLLYIATSFKTGLRQPLFATGANFLRLVVLPLILIPIAMQFDHLFAHTF